MELHSEVKWPNGSLERAAYELVAYLRDVLPQQGTWGEPTVLDSGEALTISDLIADVEEALGKS